MDSGSRALLAVKLTHTVVWAVMAAAIVALPVIGWLGRFDLVLAITVLIALEGLALALNRGACPLTAVAARYTADRRSNFDIYLPEWLAQHNKPIFGLLFAAGEAVALVSWLRR